MSKTYKHQWMFEERGYWEKHQQPLVVKVKKIIPVKAGSSSLMNRLAGDFVEIEYHLNRPKVITKHDPNKYPNMLSLEVLRRKYYRKASWRKHRRRWRKELRNENWDGLASLSKKPHDIAWEIW